MKGRARQFLSAGMGIMLLLPAAVAFASDTLVIGDTTESTTGGFKFPDGTIQTSAYSGGVTLTSPDDSITVGGMATAPTVKLNFTLLNGLYAPLSGSSNYVAKAGDTMTGTLSVTQAASGGAGSFQISSPGSSSHALYATTSGSGYAGYFSGKVNVTGAAHLASSSGNVGIGTTTPSQKLEVAGTIKATGTPGFQGDGSGLTNVSGTDSTKVAKVGDTMTGTLNVDQAGTTGRAGHLRIINAANSNAALFAYTTGTGNAGNFQISNSTSQAHALYATTTSSNSLAKAGYFAGNVHITGTLTKGGGYFVQPHGTEPSREVVYAFFEGPEHAVFLRGKAKLAKGRAVIETPEYWRVVAGSDEDITVQFTPRSADSTGLAAVEVTRERIVVRELQQGQGSYDFDYFITAKRAGFEKHEPIQVNSHFTADGITREDFEQRYANTGDMTIAAMRDLLIRNGILTADGKLDMAMAEKLGWRLKDSVEEQGR